MKAGAWVSAVSGPPCHAHVRGTPKVNSHTFAGERVPVVVPYQIDIFVVGRYRRIFRASVGIGYLLFGFPCISVVGRAHEENFAVVGVTSVSNAA